MAGRRSDAFYLIITIHKKNKIIKLNQFVLCNSSESIGSEKELGVGVEPSIQWRFHSQVHFLIR